MVSRGRAKSILGTPDHAVELTAAGYRETAAPPSANLPEIMATAVSSALSKGERVSRVREGEGVEQSARRGVLLTGNATNACVLDLAFLCPGMIVTGVLLRRRHVIALLFAVPPLVFAALEGVAIVAMMVAMSVKGRRRRSAPRPS